MLPFLPSAEALFEARAVGPAGEHLGASLPCIIISTWQRVCNPHSL